MQLKINKVNHPQIKITHESTLLGEKSRRDRHWLDCRLRSPLLSHIPGLYHYILGEFLTNTIMSFRHLFQSIIWLVYINHKHFTYLLSRKVHVWHLICVYLFLLDFSVMHLHSYIFSSRSKHKHLTSLSLWVCGTFLLWNYMLLKSMLYIFIYCKQKRVKLILSKTSVLVQYFINNRNEPQEKK